METNIESAPFVCPISESFCLYEMNEPGVVSNDMTRCPCGWFYLKDGDGQKWK